MRSVQLAQLRCASPLRSALVCGAPLRAPVCAPVVHTGASRHYALKRPAVGPNTPRSIDVEPGQTHRTPRHEFAPVDEALRAARRKRAAKRKAPPPPPPPLRERKAQRVRARQRRWHTPRRDMLLKAGEPLDPEDYNMTVQYNLTEDTYLESTLRDHIDGTTEPPPLPTEVDPEFTKLLRTYGLLPSENPAADFRDLKAEAGVAGLFMQTVQLAQSNQLALTRHDEETRTKLQGAYQRLARHLYEMREAHPTIFEDARAKVRGSYVDRLWKSLLNENSQGIIPGTNQAPWADNNILWRDFHRQQLEEAHLHRERRSVAGAGAARSLDGDGGDGPDLAQQFPWLGIQKPEPLHKLLDPAYHRRLRAEQRKGARCQCQFCANPHEFPLEPMNVPLLVTFMNFGGFIKPRTATGLCGKWHRRVARTIKQARTMGLFRYKQRWTIHNPIDAREIEMSVPVRRPRSRNALTGNTSH